MADQSLSETMNIQFHLTHYSLNPGDTLAYISNLPLCPTMHQNFESRCAVLQSQVFSQTVQPIAEAIAAVFAF